MKLRHSMRQKAAKSSQKLWRVVRYNAWDVGDRVPLEGMPALDQACINAMALAKNSAISQARRSGAPKTPRFVGFHAIWKLV
jgi:hypothetical protein